MKTRILSLVLCVLMLVSMVPVSVSAAENVVATVNGTEYADLQEAIKAAAPNGTVEMVDDVTVDKWVMISQNLTIGSGQLITLDMDGLTINGNGHSLTVNDIESARNGDLLFHNADNLNISNLTLNVAEGVAGGVSLKSGTIDGVTFNGGVYGVSPGNGEITIQNSTFKTEGTAIYYEEERDNLIVTGNEFDQGDGNVILLRGDTQFTNNKIISGRTVNVVSGSPIVSGNEFADGVRLKVYNGATAEITDNTLNYIVFDNEDDAVNSNFSNNTLTDDARDTLINAGISVPAPKPAMNHVLFALVARYAQRFDVLVSAENATVTGDTTIKYKRTGTVEIAVAEGYQLIDVIANGQSLGAVTSVTFKKVMAPQTLVIVTEPIPTEEPAVEEPVVETPAA